MPNPISFLNNFNTPEKLNSLVNKWNSTKLNSSVLNGRNVSVSMGTCTYKELCLATVKQNGMALTGVPEEYMHEHPNDYKEISLVAVSNDYRALNAVPSEMRTNEMWLAAVKQNASILMCVPE